jgi:hypothetical protein
MHRWASCAAIALVVTICAGNRAFAQNLLANPGFEDPITFNGPPFVGFWEGFSGGGPNASASNSTASPRNGTMNLDLTINNQDASFAGVFQDVEGLVAGQVGTWSGFQRTPTSPTNFGLGIEYRIEWRNSVSNTEISRTPNSTAPVPNSVYSPFSLTATVPAGADTARVVYAIQTFGGEPNPTNTGTVFLDDVSFSVIPEPSALALAGLGALGLLRRRRD